jgi:hypothetical protein
MGYLGGEREISKREFHHRDTERIRERAEERRG